MQIGEDFNDNYYQMQRFLIVIIINILDAYQCKSGVDGMAAPVTVLLCTLFPRSLVLFSVLIEAQTLFFVYINQ